MMQLKYVIIFITLLPLKMLAQQKDSFIVEGKDTTIIIDKEGKIVARHVGGADYSVTEVKNFFRDLLKK